MVALIVSMTLAFITDRALKEPVAWQIGIPYGVVDKSVSNNHISLCYLISVVLDIH